MTEYYGNLYVIRNGCTSNTVDVSPSCPAGNEKPQLWKYDGTNWTRMAQNGSNITNLGNSNNRQALYSQNCRAEAAHQ